MDVEKVKRIPLPGGASGSYLITKKMLEETDNDLSVLEDLITAKAIELGVNLMLSVEEKREGFLVTWRPH